MSPVPSFLNGNRISVKLFLFHRFLFNNRNDIKANNVQKLLQKYCLEINVFQRKEKLPYLFNALRVLLFILLKFIILTFCCNITPGALYYPKFQQFLISVGIVDLLFMPLRTSKINKVGKFFNFNHGNIITQGIPSLFLSVNFLSFFNDSY